MTPREVVSHARFWDDVYSTRDAYGAVIRLRHATALRWVDDVQPRAIGAPILEVGCGSGHLAEALAGRGLAVTAMDRALYMAEMAGRRLVPYASAGFVLQGNAETLPFASERFEMVIALGLIGWLPCPARFIQESQRVLRPGGYLIVSAANSHGLTNLLDPLTNPVLARVSQRVLASAKAHFGKRFRFRWPDDRRGQVHSATQVCRMLGAAHLELLRWTTLGFGPFSVLSHVAPAAVGLDIHDALQRWTDRGVVPLRQLGSQHLFLAQKTNPFPTPAPKG